MTITADELAMLEGAGIPLPPELIEARDRAEKLEYEVLPEALDQLFGTPAWNDKLSDTENLVLAGQAVINRQVQGKVTEQLEKLAQRQLTRDIAKYRTTLYDLALETIRKTQSAFLKELAPEVQEMLHLRTVPLDQMPSPELAAQVLAARNARAVANTVTEAFVMLCEQDGVSCGFWLQYDPADFTVASWCQMHQNGKGSARARGADRPSVLFAGALVNPPKDFAEFQAREKMLLDAERNAGGFYLDDDSRTIEQYSKTPQKSPQVRPGGRVPLSNHEVDVRNNGGDRHEVDNSALRQKVRD